MVPLFRRLGKALRLDYFGAELAHVHKLAFDLLHGRQLAVQRVLVQIHMVFEVLEPVQLRDFGWVVNLGNYGRRLPFLHVSVVLLRAAVHVGRLSPFLDRQHLA